MAFTMQVFVLLFGFSFGRHFPYPLLESQAIFPA